MVPGGAGPLHTPQAGWTDRGTQQLLSPAGQTGRFVLVQRLREKERQLLPQECPVGAQATCGQFASDVQFVLRRTGPSQAGRPSSDSCPPPERCPIRASLPPKPRPALGREPRKALTFSLGCPRLAPSPSSPVSAEPATEDLLCLERRVQRNAAELGQEAFWEQELRREQAREREGQARLQALSAATAEHAARLQALDAQARALEAQLHLAAQGPGAPLSTASATERLRQDLAAQERRGEEVQGSLALVSQALEAAESALQVSQGPRPCPCSELQPRGSVTRCLGVSLAQAQAQELEELNRELRQCNLQQFIQQAGAAPPPPRPDRASPGTQVRVGLVGSTAQPGRKLTCSLAPGSPFSGQRRAPPRTPSESCPHVQPESRRYVRLPGRAGTRPSRPPQPPELCLPLAVAPVRQNSWR